MRPPVPPIALLYEDAALVVVDKPAGVPVIPAPSWPAAACVQARTAALVGSRLWVVHRLDRDTSGALVFARTEAVHRTLSMAFEHRAVTKTYRALVAGIPSPPEGCVEVPLRDARKGRTRPAADGEVGAKAATTLYRVVRRWQGAGSAAALLELRPQTGRHHQIRVHLRAIGTPILADPVYGRGGAPSAAGERVPRLALHATALDLPHPIGGHRVRVEAEWPADLEAVCLWLDRHWHTEITSA
jgi:RluA family pseudouridine synthase